ncbi:MAG TPA: hypothetical protein VH643_40255 [Gemmataceae bacterium]
MSHITDTMPSAEVNEPDRPHWLEFLRRRRPRSLRGGLAAGLLGGLVIGAIFCSIWCFIQLSGLPLLFVPGLSVAYLIAAAVREFSGGTDRRFGFVAAALALLACLVLDIGLAWGIMMRQTGSLPRFSPPLALSLFRQHWEASHLLSYGLAAGMAYYFGWERSRPASEPKRNTHPLKFPLGLFVFFILIGGLVLFTFSGQRFNRLSLSPDGQMLVADGTGDVFSTEAVCWDLTTGEQLRKHDHFHKPPDQMQGPEFFSGEGHTGPVRCRIRSPDSHTLFTAGATDSRVKGWDALTGRQTHCFELPLAWITSLAVTSDGQTLAVAGGSFHHSGEVHLIDVNTGQDRHAFTVPVNTVRAVIFTPDDRTLIAGTMARINPFTWDRHGGVHRWDVASGQELPPLR